MRNDSDVEAEWARWKQGQMLTAASIAARRQLLWYAAGSLLIVVGFLVFILVGQ